MQTIGGNSATGDQLVLELSPGSKAGQGILATSGTEADATAGRLYNISYTQAVTTANGVLLNIANPGTKNVIVRSTKVNGAIADTYSWTLGDTGTPVGTTGTTPVNRSGGPASSATVLTTVTGLTAGGVTTQFRDAANTTADNNDIFVISPGSNASLRSLTGGAASAQVNITFTER